MWLAACVALVVGWRRYCRRVFEEPASLSGMTTSLHHIHDTFLFMYENGHFLVVVCVCVCVSGVCVCVCVCVLCVCVCVCVCV